MGSSIGVCGLQLQWAVVTTVATSVYHCSQVQAAEIEVHSEIVLLLTFDVKLRGFIFVSCCVDITIFITEVDILLTAAKVCRYDKWTYMNVNV